MQNSCTWTSSVAQFPLLFSPPPPSENTASIYHQQLLCWVTKTQRTGLEKGGCFQAKNGPLLIRRHQNFAEDVMEGVFFNFCSQFHFKNPLCSWNIQLFYSLSFRPWWSKVFFDFKPYANADKQMKANSWYFAYYISMFYKLLNGEKKHWLEKDQRKGTWKVELWEESSFASGMNRICIPRTEWQVLSWLHSSPQSSKLQG